VIIAVDWFDESRLSLVKYFLETLSLLQFCPCLCVAVLFE
jgi:hypothetical protein